MKILNKIQKELKAPKGQKNDFGKYNYRSCEDILEAVKPLLGDATLTLTDEMVMIGERFYVKATATLKGGEKLEREEVSVSAYARESLDKKGMDSAQITGAASSYARKYALNGLFCIDDTKDADTQDNTKPPQTTPKVASQKATGQICEVCKVDAVINPKTGNPYCPNWKKHKADGVFGAIISKLSESTQEFEEKLESVEY